MKNALALKIGGFTTLVSTGLLGSIAGASAATVDGCGTKPAGGTLTNMSGVCELTFKSAGSFTWTLPAGIAGLHSVLVGAGGGAAISFPNEGYGGAGGSVAYADLTSSVAGDELTVEVGSGGASALDDDGSDGEPSAILINGGGGPNASGGDGAIIYAMPWGFCDGGYFGENLGAGTSTTGQEGGPCVGGGPGIIPDSHSDAPEIFDGFTTELGHGGGVYIDATHTGRFGEGANVFFETFENVDPLDDEISAENQGADGAVIFRYTANQSLAATGNDVPVTTAALVSVAIIAAGVAGATYGRRRSRASR